MEASRPAEGASTQGEILMPPPGNKHREASGSGESSYRKAATLPMDFNDPAWDEHPPPHEPVDMQAEKVSDLVPRLKEMLRHRDQALQGERKQVRLFEAKNEALRANLDQVEAEVGSLQVVLTEANDKISASLKERRRLEKRITSLEGMLAGVKGQEYAIDVATSQNTKLVLLLQEEERKQKELDKEKQGHLDEIGGLKAKLHATTREASVVEAKLKDQLNRRSYQVDKLQAAHDHLRAEHTQLGRKYEEETSDLKAKVSALDKQVHQLKGQPYKLLDRLQKTEDALRVARDDCEREQRDMVVVEERNMELSQHLEEAVKKGNMYKEKMEFLQRSLPPLEKELASLRSKLEFERHDKNKLEGQIYDMSQSITQLVQRQAVVEEKAIQKENELARAIKGKDKEGKMQDQQLSAKDRTLAKQHQLIAVLEEAVAVAKAEAEAARVLATKSNNNTAATADLALPYKYEVQAMARRRLLDLHVQCVSSLTIAEPGAEVVTEALYQLRVLDLSSCAVTNAELSSLLQTLRLCPWVKSLDLTGNSITDEGSYALSDYLRNKACYLNNLVLRSNEMTAQALRRLAVALESNATRRIKEVILRKEGIIEAYQASPPTTAASSGSLASDGRDQEAPGGVGSRRVGAATACQEQQQLPHVATTSTVATLAIMVDARDNLLGSRRLDKEEASGAFVGRGGKSTHALQPGSGTQDRSSVVNLQAQRAFRNQAVAEVYTSRTQPRIK